MFSIRILFVGYTLWPAKVTAVVEEGSFLKRTVFPFGTGKISHIKSDSQMFLFTKENIRKFKVSACSAALSVS